MCEKCGTDHDGWPDDTFGARMACLRGQAELLGAVGLVDQIDTLHRDMRERRDDFLRDEGIIP